MIRIFILVSGCVLLMAASRLMGPPTTYSPGVQAAIDYFKLEAGRFSVSCTELRKALEGQRENGQNRMRATREMMTPEEIALVRQRLTEARLRYKRIESFLEYFFRSSATIYNRPPKFEAEDGSMEYQSPIGLQFMETLLYEQRLNRKALLEQAKAVESSALDLPALLYGLKADDGHLLESLRIELIRVIALDITGYEAPMLKTGITESREAIAAMEVQLQPYLGAGPREDSVRMYLGRCSGLLTGDFDGFDRLRFLRDGALPLQRVMGRWMREKGLEVNTTKTLNYGADDIFSPDAFLMEKFGGGGLTSDSLVGRGRQLFFDSSLSGNGRKSCASCHQPSKAFTDGLPVSVGLDGHQRLDRNAPTLLYSGYQFAQFWDGRVNSLEEQIRTVLHDKREMGAAVVRELDVAAIAAFVKSLHPMNSEFDRFVRGTGTISSGARRGANLFMGKAQCATCHFIPLFNGLIPPDYAVTEYEVLGTTMDDRGLAGTLDAGRKFVLSPDSGRYGPYPLPFFRGAFKTPTVRDAAVTAPYMHNGGFGSLETVMAFYNNGGGVGMGLTVPEQTLSSDKLRLSTGEIRDIILFIHTLTDTLNAAP